MHYILALDQGTTSSRAIVFDTAGSVVAVQQQEFTQHFPQSGWVEHDAMEIWHSQLHVAQQVLSANRIEPSQIAAIGITNQRETTVLWDKVTGKPSANAIVWQDRRTAALCDALRQAGHADTIAAKTGLVLDAYFSATKLAWLLDNVPEARTQAAAGRLAFGTIDTWLMWQLTGGKVHATDVSNASRTMLWNIHTQSWDADLLALLGIPASVLPKVQTSSGLFGRTTLLGGDLPIAGVAGDQQAATFGQACWQPGMVKNTYGTGCFLLCNTGNTPVASQHRLLTTAGWQLPQQALQYCVEGSVFMGGATVQWLRDGLGIIQKASDVESLAASVPDNGGVMLVPALTGLGAPHWDAQARGTLLGLTRGTTRAHIARAALEGIAHQVADVALAMQADMQASGGQSIQELRVDGGAAANDLLLQIQADLLQIPVVRPKVTETTALGAAYLAGLAVGFWASQDALASQWQVDRRFTPTPGSAAWQASARAMWQRALGRAGQWHDG